MKSLDLRFGIENQERLAFFMYCSELFNPDRLDTYYEPVK